MRDNKILVIGGNGFIGSKTVDALIKFGFDVCVVDNMHSAKKIGARFYNANAIEPNLKDIFKKEKPKIVYDFAFNPKSYRETDISAGWESVKMSLNILKNCQEHKVKKLIFASSGAVYGNAKNFPTKETDLITPDSPYAISKSSIENFIKFFNKNFGLNYVILRYATVYGPGQFSGAMSEYIRFLSSGKQADIFGDGKKTSDYVYIDDVVRANILTLKLAEDFKEPIFNVSSGKEISLNKLYETIALLLNKKPNPSYLAKRPGELTRYCLDYSKIKKVLGWELQYSLKEGLIKRLKEEKLI